MKVKFYCGEGKNSLFEALLGLNCSPLSQSCYFFICKQIVSTFLYSWFSCCFGCIAVEDLQNACGPVCFPMVSSTSCSTALDLVTTSLLAQLCYVKCLLRSGMVSACLVITKDAVLLPFVSIMANGFRGLLV